MSVFLACRLPLLVAVSAVGLSACLDGHSSVAQAQTTSQANAQAIAQARNDLDAIAYNAPEAAAPQPQLQPRPMAPRGLFTGSTSNSLISSSSGSSSGGLFGALASVGSKLSLPRRSAPQQAYAQMQPPQVYAQSPSTAPSQPTPRNDLDNQVYSRPPETPATPTQPQQQPAQRQSSQRGLLNSDRASGSGGAIAALRAGIGSSRRGYAPTPVGYGRTPAYAPVVTYDPNYRLDAGDKLRVVVYGQEGLTNSYAISASGTITMPLIGNVPARGSTPAALAAHITGRLRDGFIREPSVAVEIEAYRPFFILGEVAAPGQYPYVPHMSIESAVAIAGGFSPRAKRDLVTLTHSTPEGLLRAVVPVNTPLTPGDTIMVGERWF